MTGQPIATMDERAVEAFAERLLHAYTQSMVTLMIDVAHRTGLLNAIAAGPGTSEEMAKRAGLVERYVRECLGALVTGGIVDYDASTRNYSVPPERALYLTGEGSLNFAPLSQFTSLLAKTLPDVVHAFRAGGGVPYERFRPEFTGVMDGTSRGFFDGQLIQELIPLTGELPTRLAEGIRVADIAAAPGTARTSLLGPIRSRRSSDTTSTRKRWATLGRRRPSLVCPT